MDEWLLRGVLVKASGTETEARGGKGERAAGATRGGRVRRVMPRVAVAAVVLCVVWLLVRGAEFYQDSAVAGVLGIVTFLVACVAVVYYAYRALRWLKRKLLWRVRRRLVITYLFVGLTPLVLLSLLGFFSAMGGSSQALERIVVVQVNETERQALESARKLARAGLQLPANASDQSAQAWLDERAGLLRSALPGVRVAMWRGTDARETTATLGRFESARFISAPPDEAARGLGDDVTETGAPLPEWLDGRDEWSGLAYVPPVDSSQPFGSPSMRALVRERANGRAVALVLTVPVSRALLERWHATTGIRIRPFFLSADGFDASVNASEQGGFESRVTLDEERRVEDKEAVVLTQNGRKVAVDFSRDQLGEPMTFVPLVRQPYPVFLASTNWLNGTRSPRLAFMFDWSWQTARDQLMGDSTLGQWWRTALVYTAVAFLIFELLALLSAAWMTRAVTGAVHKLHRATGFIKRGDFSHRVPVNSHDQLGELSSAFNDMSGDIESLLKERVERERLQREVEIAAEVQAQLFPHAAPHLSTAAIAGECRAARGVAGDYYDYIEVADGLVALALGDVSGKGISAALVMSNLQAALRAQTTIIAERLKVAERSAVLAAAIGGGSSSSGGSNEGASFALDAETGASGAVENMVANLNTQLCMSTESNRFATLFLALYDDRTRMLRYTNAGHNAAILVRSGGAVERLSTGGTMVGAFDFSVFEEAQTTLASGDTLVIFSDGLSEAQNPQGEEYGEERLVRFVVEHGDRSPDELRRAIFDEIEHWSGAKERDDDQTLVIMEAKG